MCRLAALSSAVVIEVGIEGHRIELAPTRGGEAIVPDRMGDVAEDFFDRLAELVGGSRHAELDARAWARGVVGRVVVRHGHGSLNELGVDLIVLHGDVGQDRLILEHHRPEPGDALRPLLGAGREVPLPVPARFGRRQPVAQHHVAPPFGSQRRVESPGVHADAFDFVGRQRLGQISQVLPGPVDRRLLEPGLLDEVDPVMDAVTTVVAVRQRVVPAFDLLGFPERREQ